MMKTIGMVVNMSASIKQLHYRLQQLMYKSIWLEQRSGVGFFEGAREATDSIDALNKVLNSLVEQADAFCLMRSALLVLMNEGSALASDQLDSLENGWGLDADKREADAISLLKIYKLGGEALGFESVAGELAFASLVSNREEVARLFDRQTTHPLNIGDLILA